jgi:hypothetical protein
MANEFWIRFRGKDVDASKTARDVRDNLKGLGKQAEAYGKASRGLAEIWGDGHGLQGSFRKVSTLADLASKAGYKVATSLGKTKAMTREAASGVDAISKGLGGGLDAIATHAGVAEEAGAGLAALAGPIGLAVGAVVGVTGALIAGEGAAIKYTSAWAMAGRNTLQASRIFGVASGDLQQLRGAGQQLGVDIGGVDNSIGSLGQTIQDALMGRNQEAYVAMRRLNLEIKRTRDGSIDTKAMLLQLADAYTKIPSAQGRALMAQMFGVDPRLLQGGSAGLQKRMAQFKSIGGVDTAADLARAQREAEKLTGLQQRWEAVNRRAKVILSPLADVGLGIAEKAMMGPRERAQRDLGWTKAAWAGLGVDVDRVGKSMHDLANDLGPTWDRIKAALGRFGQGVAVGARHVGQAAGRTVQDVETAVGGWVRQTLGYRNNNPGNIRGSSGEGGFRRYANMGAGLADMGRLLRDNYQGRHGLNTIRGIENRYAPSSENPTSDLIARIAKSTGWNPDEAHDLRDPKQLATLMQAMIGVEQGQTPFSRDDIMAALGAGANGGGAKTISKHQLDLYLHGLPAGAGMRVASSGEGRANVRIGRAMPAGG